jgi:5-(carboxyamino)imidazole ribonucleotide mutase
LSNADVAKKMENYKAGLGAKIEKANQELSEVKYEYKTN